jgi:hypothetical protein
MDQYRVEYRLSASMGWKAAINADQLTDAVITGMKLSHLDLCEYRVRLVRQAEIVIAEFNAGEVLKDDSGVYKVGAKFGLDQCLNPI